LLQNIDLIIFKKYSDQSHLGGNGSLDDPLLEFDNDSEKKIYVLSKSSSWSKSIKKRQKRRYGILKKLEIYLIQTIKMCE
jgi:hypothetical protein